MEGSHPSRAALARAAEAWAPLDQFRRLDAGVKEHPLPAGTRLPVEAARVEEAADRPQASQQAHPVAITQVQVRLERVQDEVLQADGAGGGPDPAQALDLFQAEQVGFVAASAQFCLGDPAGQPDGFAEVHATGVHEAGDILRRPVVTPVEQKEGAEQRRAQQRKGESAGVALEPQGDRRRTQQDAGPKQVFLLVQTKPAFSVNAAGQSGGHGQ